MVFTPSSNCYKHPNGTFLGFIQSHDQVTQSNSNDHYHDMQHGFGTWLGQEDYFSPLPNNYGDLDDVVVPEVANFDCSSAYSMTSGLDFMVSDQGVDHDQLLPALPECKVYSNSSSEYGECLGESGFGVGFYQDGKNGEEGNVMSSMFESYVQPNNCASTTLECWGLQGQMSTSVLSGENHIKVGRYSVEERRARILRYLKKRNQRNFNKTIKYACRKALADRRVRIHGRFAKNNEDETQMSNSATTQDENLAVSYDNANKNEEYYEDEWLQQAMASLMYAPCMPPAGWLWPSRT